MLQDLRFAIRLMVRERWYTAAAIVALALGIGANVTVFSMVNAAFLRGLPFEDAHQLYMLAWQPRSGTRSNVAYPDLLEWRAQSRTFTALAAFSSNSANISDARGLPDLVQATWLTANAFSLLGQPPLLGRDFAPPDERSGAERVVLLSYRLWKNRYGGDPGVIGQSMRLNGQPATIVGVMPDKVNFPINAELWAPFIPTAAQEQRSARPLSVFGRLRPDATRAQAYAEFTGIAQRLAAAYPDTNKELAGIRIETFQERFVGGNARVIFLAMMGAVGFVLLIACANVANLLLSRSMHRAREIAVRRALGATRWRVLRQLLLESLVLGTIGGGLGLLIALAGVPAFDASVTDRDKPYWIVFQVDGVVVAYVAAICVLTAIVFGLAPALHVSKTDVHGVLKDGGRGQAGGRRTRWLSGTMVIVELALTIVLLTGAGLMIRSFVKLYTLDLGIDTAHLLSMRFQLPNTKYATPEARLAFLDRLEPRLSGLPGIEAIAVTSSVPPFGGGQRPFEIERRPVKQGEPSPAAHPVLVTARFFDVVRAPLLRGRAFHDQDGTPGFETIVINQRAAARFFPGEDPIGKRIRLAPREPPPSPSSGAAAGAGADANPPEVWRTIVGISATIRHTNPRETEPSPVVYIPARQDPPAGASLLMRSRLPPNTVMDAVRREVQRLDPDQPVFTIGTLDQMLAQSRWPFRVFGTLLALFALIALVLSAVGLYAVMAYSVTQQTQEIGVRMALGAEARQVSWLVLKRGLVQLAIGLTLGLAGAYALSGVLRTIVVQVQPTDPLTFAIVATILSLVAIAACLLPARRAARVDPLVALRGD